MRTGILQHGNGSGGHIRAEQLISLARTLEEAQTIVIGAGAGLSISAGFVYEGERFARYFADFGAKYGFHDMYTGGFWPYETLAEYWAYWSRYIYVNRFMDPPLAVYERLYELVRGRDYFVITTNVDHCFQKAGFDRKRLFYTQGDYGLFQCSGPCRAKTYDNKELVKEMLTAQGFAFDGEENLLPLPDSARRRGERNTASDISGVSGISGDGAMSSADMKNGSVKMTIPLRLVPCCPVCGRPMTMNLRSDDTFVEDDGWHAAAARYQNFLRTRTGGKIVYLELGVGYNTPVIIKYPFWQLTARNADAAYVCINKGNAGCPPEIHRRSICIDADIGETLEAVPLSTQKTSWIRSM